MSVFYVPAGLEQTVNNYHTLYTKAEAHEQESSDFIDGRRIWKTKTHTLEYVASNYNRSVVPEDEYTYCIPNNGPAYLKLNGMRLILVNPFNKSLYMPSSFRDAGLQVIADSGGFQFISNKSEFIEPISLAKSYNRCATLGMDLDIPPRSGIGKDLVLASAKVQNANYELMSQHINKKVHLVTIIHGRNLDERKLWMDTIGREDSEYISVAGLLRMFSTDIPMELSFLEQLLLVISRYRNTKYIHCLGLTSMPAIFVFALLDHLGVVKNIGGDSVSYILSSSSGGSFSFYPWNMYKIPKNFHVNAMPACSCPICRSTLDFRLNGTYLMKGHNLYIKNKHKEYITNLTNLLLDEQIKVPEFLALTNLSTPRHVVEKCIEYVQEFKASGQYKPIKRKKNTLFNSKTKVDKIDPKAVEVVTRIIKNYEKYYQKGFL